MAYSDLTRAQALTALAANGNDLDKTAAEMGVGRSTLKRWAKCGPKKGLAEMLEEALAVVIARVPDRFDGQQWAVAVGILTDKLLLMQGDATSRSENILRRVDHMTESERDDLYAEAEAILAQAAGGRPGAGRPEAG